ncbi:unnamed protein product [Ixodes pacificus]
MSSELDILKEMGFSEQRAEKALQVCGSQGVEAAMEWLLAHADEAMDTNEPVPAVNPPATNVSANTEKGSGTTTRSQLHVIHSDGASHPRVGFGGGQLFL